MAPEQATVVEELWTFLSDYLDRMAARADVAINEAALHQGVREQVQPPRVFPLRSFGTLKEA